MALPKDVIVGALAAILALSAAASSANAGSPQAGSVILPNLPPDYDWWNGCAPTAAAMLFAWWGQQGYGAFPANYPAPPATYPVTSTNSADYTDARGVIAGWADKQAGMDWGLTYGNYRSHPPDSLADFLLTFNGNTPVSNVAHGLVSFGAWDDPRTPQIESRQFTVSTSYTASGLTYDQYVAEINAGRPVFLGWSSATFGHATLGVGYNNTAGKHDVITLTTWHQGPQEWQWTNETSSGYGLSVDSAVLMQPASTATPRLSAYLSISRDYIGDLQVDIGDGDPQNPQWNTTVRSPDNSQDHNLVMTDINAMPELSAFRTSSVNWYLKVSAGNTSQYPGTIQDFQIRYGLDQHVFHYTGSPIPIVANGSAYVYLNSTSFAIFSTWQGTGTSSASWGNDPIWDQGVPQYAGDTATFGNSIGTAIAIITLDGDRTVAALTLSNTHGGSYHIAQGASGTLTLDGGTAAAMLTDAAGSHEIAAPVVLATSTLVTVTNSSDTLTLSGSVSGTSSLEKGGSGTLALLGGSAYLGDTTVDAGTLKTLAITGTGSTTVAAGAILQTNCITQSQLSIGIGAQVILGGVTASASAAKGAAYLAGDVIGIGIDGSASSATNSIPEPATCTLLASAACCLWVLQPRRKPTLSPLSLRESVSSLLKKGTGSEPIVANPRR